eukprot:2069402-Prymnesium_polylepis.2
MGGGRHPRSQERRGASKRRILARRAGPSLHVPLAGSGPKAPSWSVGRLIVVRGASATALHWSG